MRFVFLVILAAVSCGGANHVWAAPVEHTAHAILQAEDEVVLSSEMAGRLNTLSFEEGAEFSSGDVLAAFSCEILEAEVRVSEATVAGATAELKNAQHLDKLKAAGALDLVLAQAALNESRARLDVAKSRARLCRIVAPYDGVVLSREVREFESVDVMTPVLRIGRTGPLRVSVIAPSSWLSWIKVGESFAFTPNSGGTSFPGEVDRIGASVDAASQTVKIEGVLTAQTPGLLPGQSGVIRFADDLGEAQ